MRAVYDNLQTIAAQLPPAVMEQSGETDDPMLNLALRVDRAVKTSRPDSWRGHAPRENVIKSALLTALGGNVEAVLQIFPTIVEQKEY